MADEKKPSVKRQGRSPAYPSLTLAEALDKAQAQYDAEGKYPAPLISACKAWGYSPKSSGGRDVRASLRYFGLITVDGEGDQAKVKLTEDALRVITDKREDQSEKKAIIKRLALNPTAHKKLWSEYPEGIKSDATAAHHLVWVEGYNEAAAAALVAEFKATASFAGIYEPATVDVIKGQTEDEKPPQTVEIGDMVNVERDGVLVFPKPVKVSAIEEHNGQVWVWTEGSEAWTEMETVILESKGAAGVTLTPPPAPAHVLAALANKGTPGGAALPAASENEIKVMLDGPFLRVSAVVDAKGAKKLMKALQANIALLSDDEDDDLSN